MHKHPQSLRSLHTQSKYADELIVQKSSPAGYVSMDDLRRRLRIYDKYQYRGVQYVMKTGSKSKRFTYLHTS